MMDPKDAGARLTVAGFEDLSLIRRDVAPPPQAAELRIEGQPPEPVEPPGRAALGRVEPDLPPYEALSTDAEAHIIPTDSPGG